MAKNPLCDKQRKFCNYLLRGFPKKVAAVKAGYSPQSAASQASQMLGRQHVQDYLKDHYERESAVVAIEREQVRKRLLNYIMADLSAVYDDEWNLRSKKDIPRKVRALIVSVKKWQSEDQGQSVSVKLMNQLDAIKAYLRFFPETEKKAEDLTEAADQVESSFEELIQKLEQESRPANGSDPS